MHICQRAPLSGQGRQYKGYVRSINSDAVRRAPYEITLTKDSVQHGSNKSSGTSHDKDAIIERVIGQRADGFTRNWSFA